jgi:hypothetical protein
VPKGKKIVSSKWAFRVTWDVDGNVKYWARIVARRFSQIPHLDFDQTYAPTVQFKTLSLGKGDWEILQGKHQESAQRALPTIAESQQAESCGALPEVADRVTARDCTKAQP